VSGIKVITVFHSNRSEGLPSHQGVVILFDGKHGQPLIMCDAAEITAIRTAAASGVATKLLAKKDAETLTIVGAGEQAKQHINAIMCVKKIKQINIWNRAEKNAEQLAEETFEKYKIPVSVKKNIKEAVKEAAIICTTTSSKEPIIMGEWISDGAHINAVGSSIAVARELDTNAVVRSKLFTDCYESIFNEGGDFLIPKKEGAIDDTHVKAEIGEVLLGKKAGRENDREITLFKSLGIAAEDIFSAEHIYKKITQKR
jgi:ornithine cyclodeaminase